MAIHPKRYKLDAPPNVYLDGRVLVFVDPLKYLGHTITCDFTDDEDIMRELRSLIEGQYVDQKLLFLLNRYLVAFVQGLLLLALLLCSLVQL